MCYKQDNLQDSPGWIVPGDITEGGRKEIMGDQSTSSLNFIDEEGEVSLSVGEAQAQGFNQAALAHSSSGRGTRRNSQDRVFEDEIERKGTKRVNMRPADKAKEHKMQMDQLRQKKDKDVQA